MPRLIQPAGRTETLVDAINYLLARDGASALTLRMIARESRVSTSSILHHFESRERLLLVAARMTGEARIRAIEGRAWSDGVCAFLPAPNDEEDLITTRAWLGWCELWRSDEAFSTTMTRARDEELLLLAHVLGIRVGDHDLTPVGALIDGLTMAVCAPVRPLPPQRAREVLARYVESDPVLARAAAG